jgi:hypothetical protein
MVGRFELDAPGWHRSGKQQTRRLVFFQSYRLTGRLVDRDLVDFCHTDKIS